MKKLPPVSATTEAIREEMQRDERVFVLGEDVEQGLFGITRGLCDEFGRERVIDTPISEAGFAGVALGAAIHGMRPIVNFCLASFMYPACDQILNETAKVRHMFGGQVKVPVTYVCLYGALGSVGSQHSDSPHSIFINSPGLKIALPSTAYDVKGLLKQAIREEDPVIVFISPRCATSEIPEEEYTIPFGMAEIRREGRDITIIATGHLAAEAVIAADQLAEDGISTEVVDLRTAVPLDKERLLKSVAKTGRVVIADDSPRACGFAAEIAALIAEDCFDALKAPIRRVTRLNVPPPFSPPLEAFMLPSREKIIDAVHELLS